MHLSLPQEFLSSSLAVDQVEMHWAVFLALRTYEALLDPTLFGDRCVLGVTEQTRGAVTTSCAARPPVSGHLKGRQKDPRVPLTLLCTK